MSALDFSTVMDEVVDPVSGQLSHSTSAMASALNQTAAAINALSGTVTFSAATHTFATRTAAAAADLTGAVFVEWQGFAVAGDGGAALGIVTGTTAPSHGAYFTDAASTPNVIEILPDASGYNGAALGLLGQADDSTVIQAGLDVMEATRKSLWYPKGVYNCEGLTLDLRTSSVGAGRPTLDFGGSVLRQITSGALILTVYGHRHTVRRAQLDTYNQADSADVLMEVRHAFFVVFSEIDCANFGLRGKIRIRNDGLGGTYWSEFRNCDGWFVIDPGVDASPEGANASSVNRVTFHGPAICTGFELLAPTETGPTQQAYSIHCYDLDMDNADGVFRNYYTDSIGTGTADRYFPHFHACSWEGKPTAAKSGFIGRCECYASHVSTDVNAFPGDQNYADTRVNVSSSLSDWFGSYEPGSGEPILVIDPDEGWVPDRLTTDFPGNSTWTNVADATNAAPTARYLRWQKTATDNQDSPAITLTAAEVRRCAMFGGVSIAWWAKSVTLKSSFGGYKKPASASTRSSSGATFSEIETADGWVVRWVTVGLARSERTTTDDLTLFLSETNLNVAAEHHYGPIVVTAGKINRAPSVPPRQIRASLVECPADGSTDTVLHTLTIPTNFGGAFSYEAHHWDMTANVQSVATGILQVARGTGSSASAALVNGSILEGPNSAGAISSITVAEASGTVTLRARLGAVGGSPNYTVRTTLRPLGVPDAVGVAG